MCLVACDVREDLVNIVIECCVGCYVCRVCVDVCQLECGVCVCLCCAELVCVDGGKHESWALWLFCQLYFPVLRVCVACVEGV